MLRRCRSGASLGSLNLGEPRALALAGLIVEVAADPLQELRSTAIVGDERGPVDGDQSAAAIHLLFEFRQTIANQQRMIERVAIGAVGDDDDRVGRVERAGIARPAVEIDIDLGWNMSHRPGLAGATAL